MPCTFLLVMALWGTLVSCLTGCGRAKGDVLAIESILPEDGSTLLLNQSVVIRFDRPLDPLCVTQDSVRLVDGRGRSVVPLRIRVRESTIEIVPRAPIHAALDDGSYGPGSKLQLLIATYPRPDGLRSERGALLVKAPTVRYDVVDAAARAAEGRLTFLPSSGDGPFRLVEVPRVDPSGKRIELRFDRPFFPPSATPEAFRLIDDLQVLSPIPLTVEAGGLGQMRGRVLYLEPAQAIPPSGGLLFFRTGVRGLLDYRLSPLEVPADPMGYQFPGLGRSLAIRPAPQSEERSDGVDERFVETRPSISSKASFSELALPFECEGSLRWGPDGLWLPRVAWPDFQSLGELDPPGSTRELRPSARAEVATGIERVLPEHAWDFDRVHIGSGKRVYVVLPDHGALRIRIAGRCEIDGEWIFRVRAAGARPARQRSTVDTRPLWRDVDGRVEIEVAGHARIRGHVRTEPDVVGLAGWLQVRDAGLLGPSNIDLQIVEVPELAGLRAESAPQLPGRWCAVSPWYPLPRAHRFSGAFEATEAEALIDVFVQGRSALPGGEVSPWMHIEGLSGLGELEALRFVVAARGIGDGGLVLRSLRIR